MPRGTVKPLSNPRVNDGVLAFRLVSFGGSSHLAGHVGSTPHDIVLPHPPLSTRYLFDNAASCQFCSFVRRVMWHHIVVVFGTTTFSSSSLPSSNLSFSLSTSSFDYNESSISSGVSQPPFTAAFFWCNLLPLFTGRMINSFFVWFYSNIHGVMLFGILVCWDLLHPVCFWLSTLIAG